MLTVRTGPYQSALEDAFAADLVEIKAADSLAPIAVVTPSRRLADRLQRLLAVEAGLSLLNVRFHTFYSLAVELCESAGGPGCAVVGDGLFHDKVVDSLLRERLGAVPSRGMAAAYRSTIRDLVDAGIDSASIRENLADYFEQKPEWAEDWKGLKDLLDLQERYLARLTQAGVMPVSGLTRTATALVEDGKSRLLDRWAAVLYYGFYDLTGLQADFLKAVAGAHPRTFVYFPYREGHPAYKFARRLLQVKLQPAGKAGAYAGGTEGRALGAALDALFDDSKPPAPVGPDRLRLISASGARDEAWAAAKEILLLRQGEQPVPFQDIGIVARTLEPYRTVLPEVLRENAIPFSMPEGEPVLRFPAAKLCLSLLTLKRREFPAKTVLDVVQSPYFRRASFAGKSRGEALVAEWTLLIAKTGVHSGWLQWESKVAPWARKDFELFPHLADEGLSRTVAKEDAAALWGFLEDVHRRLAGPAQGADWAGMAAHALALLEDVLSVPEGDPGEPAWEAVREALRGMELFDLAFPGAGWQDFLDALEERLRRALLDPGAENMGVRVLNAMDARGESFRFLFVLGLREGLFPRSIEQDPLLKDSMREQLQQPGGYWLLPKRSGIDGLDGYGEEKLLFHLTAAAASERLYCVHPRSDDEGKPQVPSFYLRALCRAAGRTLEEEDRRVERRVFAKLEALAGEDPGLLSPKEVTLLLARDGEDPASFLKALGRDASLLGGCLKRLPELARRGEPGAMDGVVGRPEDYLRRVSRAGYSPAALQAFSLCPFKFFASRVLALDEPEQPSERGELAPWMKGRIYHAVLERFHGGLKDSGWWEITGEPPWRPALERAFEDAFSDYDWRSVGLYPLLWEAEQARMRMHLEHFVAWDLKESKESGFKPSRFEIELRGEAAGIPLRGRADRIDLGRGQARVVDYKSRRLSEELRAQIGKMRQLQAPIYLELAGQDASLGPARLAGALFYLIEESEEYTGREPFQRFSGEDWAAARPRFLENLKAFTGLIEQGQFIITPDETEHGACAHCSFDRLCRKAHPLTRGRAAGSKAAARLERARELPLPDKKASS